MLVFVEPVIAYASSFNRTRLELKLNRSTGSPRPVMSF